MDKEIQHGPTMQVAFGEAMYYQTVFMPHLSYKKYDVVKGLDINWFASYSNLERHHVDTSVNIYNWYGEIDGQRTLGGEQYLSLSTIQEDVYLNLLNLVYELNENHKVGLNYTISHLKRVEQDPILSRNDEGFWAPQTFVKSTSGIGLQSKFKEGKIKSNLFAKHYANNALVRTFEIIEGVQDFKSAKANTANYGIGLAGSYKLNKSWMFNLSAEQASRLPEENEVLGDGLSVTSTTELNAETSFNINASFTTKFNYKKANKFSVSSNYFFRNVNDLIQRWQYDMGVFKYINFDKVRMQGVDAKANWNYKSKLTVTSAFSYLNPIVKSKTNEDGDENILFNTKLPNTPLIQSNLDVKWRLKNILQKGSKAFIQYGVNYVGEFYRYAAEIGSDNQEVIPLQFINNVGLGYTFPFEKLTLSANFKNIFDAQAFDNFAIQKPGRAIYIKASYNLNTN